LSLCSFARCVHKFCCCLFLSLRSKMFSPFFLLCLYVFFVWAMFVVKVFGGISDCVAIQSLKATSEF
jgi:hypothetical protein